MSACDEQVSGCMCVCVCVCVGDVSGCMFAAVRRRR